MSNAPRTRNTQQVVIRLPLDLFDAIQAARGERSLTDVVVEALREALREGK